MSLLEMESMDHERWPAKQVCGTLVNERAEKVDISVVWHCATLFGFSQRVSRVLCG